MRPVRSFVLREGRITPAQQRAFADHWSRYGLDYSAQVIDLDTVFGRQAPRVMEIGFGNGEALAWAAEHDQQRDYIGVEVHRPGVGRLMNALSRIDARNVRIFRHDAVEVLQHALAENSLDEVRVWFPDPWPKKRHHKRRIVQGPFLELVADRLRPGGRLHIATDWDPYAEHIGEIIATQTRLVRCEDARDLPGPASRPHTRFERRGQALGHSIHDFILRRT